MQDHYSATPYLLSRDNTRVVRGAAIYAGNHQQDCYLDGALIITDGRIEWIGDAGDMPNAPGAETLDLGGRVLMPGLVNTHAHGGMGLHRGCCDAGDLFSWARSIAPHTSTLTLAQARHGCWQAVLEMVSQGITTVCDCTRYGAGVFASVASAVGMRSLSGALANSPSLRPDGRPNWPLALEETEAAMQAHAGDGLSRFYLGAHSPYSCTPELMVAVKEAARERGLPFVIHVSESAKEVDLVLQRHGCRPVELLHRLGLLDRQTVLVHCVWLTEHEQQLIAESGAGVAHNPVSNAKLASGVAPVPGLRARGVPVGLGTDSTVSNNSLNLFQEMKFAALLQRAHREDALLMTAPDLLSMAGAEGAQVLGWDADIGSLEVGKQADMVALDLSHPLGWTAERLRSDLVYAAGPQHVFSVTVAGETIYRAGRFPCIDEAEIRSRFPGTALDFSS